jgi:hypothetical protein
MRYRIGYDATWINKFCACIPDSGPSQTSQERGTRFVGTVKETKGQATRHPLATISGKRLVFPRIPRLSHNRI